MHTQSCSAVYFPCCYFVLVLLPSYQKFSSLKYWLCQKPFFFFFKSVCCMSWGHYERFTVYCTGAITYTLSCFYIKWKWASLTDGSAVALDIMQLFFLRPKCSHVFHIWPAVQLTSTCCSCHFSCCMCLCVFIPTHECLRPGHRACPSSSDTWSTPVQCHCGLGKEPGCSYCSRKLRGSKRNIPSVQRRS